MNESNLKNMVVLKNLPSNIVEEAIIILKNTRKIKKLEKIEKSKIKDNTIDKEVDKNYIIKEAEMVISNYILQLEEKKKKYLFNTEKIEKRYKRLKIYSSIVTIIMIVQVLLS